MPDYLTSLKSLQTSASRDGILKDCMARAKELGFENVSIFSAGSAVRTPIFLTTYPQKWTDRYLSERYFLVDPVVSKGRTIPGPIVWGGRDYLQTAVHEGRQMLLEARQFGIRSALSVPFFCADGRYNLITFSTGHSRAAFDDLMQAFEAEVIRIAIYAHMALSELDLADSLKVFELTSRQKTCLRLILSGRTNAEIAELLSLSEATVRYHLAGAIKRTKARNSTHAAFIAHQQSIL